MSGDARAVVVPGLSSSPLSSAVVLDGVVYASGQVGRDPATGMLPPDFEGQMRQALANLERVLEAAGSSLAGVVKTTVFLPRRSDFAAMNALYAERFPEPRPARSTLVCDLASEDLLFEIEAVARIEG